jgi:hypothetical protein
MRRVVNGERRSRVCKVLTGAFVPADRDAVRTERWKQLERRANALGNSGTISESVRLVRGVDGGTIAMKIEYLAAIAIAAFAAGGLAVPSIGSLPPEKQSTPAAAQLATLLAESVDPFLLRSGG